MSLVKNLYRDYGDFKIEVPELSLPDEGVLALWGSSGSGKTSIVRLLTGIEPCPGLSWTFKNGNRNGHQDLDVARLKAGDRHLGVVFQDFALFPHLTAKQNIEFAAQARKQTDYKARMDELVSKLHLNGCLNRRADKISGGEKQRVAIARALMTRPRMLLLDEPFSALDANVRGQARDLVKSVIESEKIPTLLITHDPEDVRVLAQRVVEIKNGRVVSDTAVQEFLNKFSKSN